MTQEAQYQWTDNPTVSGIAVCNTDILNDCLMHLKYDKKDGGTSLSLFTPVVQDHLLSFEESKGYALQGTYVYSTGVAGERYGYPAFVQKCIEEKSAGTATETTLGSNTVTIYTNANGHQFYDIADKSSIDAFYESTGIAWFYGIDEENERVFLPRGNKYTAIGDLTSVPVQIYGDGNALAFYASGNSQLNYLATNNSYNNSKPLYLSDPTSPKKQLATVSVPETTAYGGSQKAYGIATKSQIPAGGTSGLIGTADLSNKMVGGYLYIIVGNTEVETAETEVVDITTSENDTIPLGFSIWQKGVQASVAWLASNGQWNSGEMYKTFYNEYVPQIGQPFCNGYVRSNTDDYTDYDLVINETDMTFRLPLTNGQNPVIESGNNYNIYANGYCEQWGHGDSATVTLLKAYKDIDYNVQGIWNNITSGSAYSLLVRSNTTSTIIFGTKWGSDNSVADFKNGTYYWKTSGILAENEYTPPTLYFKVDNAVQNQQLIDLGEVTNTLSTKVSFANTQWVTDACVPSYENATTRATGSYTETVNGYLIAFPPNNGTSQWSVTIGGKSFNFQQGYTGTDYNHPTGNWFMIPKNTNYSLTSSNMTIYFVPMKGEINA